MFKLAELDSQSMQKALTKAADSGLTTLEMGALMLADAQDEWQECGADPAAIGAVSAHAYGADTAGYGGHGRREFPPGYIIGIPVAGEVPFRATYTGTLPSAPGGSYGVVKDATLGWSVDFSDTTATRVKLVRILDQAPVDSLLNEVIVVFLAANAQILT